MNISSNDFFLFLKFSLFGAIFTLFAYVLFSTVVYATADEISTVGRFFQNSKIEHYFATRTSSLSWIFSILTLWLSAAGAAYLGFISTLLAKFFFKKADETLNNGFK